jgi:hypothetical protein
MSSTFYKFLGIGLVIMAAVIGFVLLGTRGSHIELKGRILKVRTLGPEPASSIVLVDFRFENPSDYPFVVRTVDVIMTGKDGKEYQGQVISEPDMRTIFLGYPILGQKFNETLKSTAKIPPRSGMDRMVGARFEVPEEVLAGRKQLRIRVEDVDGPVSVIDEHP